MLASAESEASVKRFFSTHPYHCLPSTDNAHSLSRKKRIASSVISEEYLSVSEVAKILHLSPESVIARFEKRPGVIDLGRPETRFRRQYRILRIPREVLEKYIIERRVA